MEWHILLHMTTPMVFSCWVYVQVGTVEEYLEKGPGFIFLFHPALGPMWDVVAQKIRGGALMHGSELVLEACHTTSLATLLACLSCGFRATAEQLQYFEHWRAVSSGMLRASAIRVLPFNMQVYEKLKAYA